MSKSSETLKRWLLRAAPFGVAALIAAGVVYWLNFSPVAVRAHAVALGAIQSEVMGTGTLEARVKTTISSKIAGRISEVLVDQNATVSAGQLLVQLDDDELKQQVAIAEANVAARQAAIERLKSDRERAIAVATQARKQQGRLELLVDKKAASQEDLDKAIEALSVAVAGVSHAEAAMTEGERELIAAERTLEYHKARLADTKVVAPFDGLIVRRTREPGDVVVPGSSVLSLIATTEIWVSAWVDETEMAKLQPDQPARVVFRSEPNRSYRGKVSRLGREADRETREFLVDVQVLELPKNWAIGQRAEVYIETARKESATLVPAAYVLWRDDVAGVFADEGGKAVWKPVSIGLRNPQEAEITEGIQTGETIVMPVDPRAKLTPGRRVVAP